MAPSTRIEVLRSRRGTPLSPFTMDLYTHLYEDEDPDEVAALDTLYTSAARPALRVVGSSEFSIGTR